MKCNQYPKMCCYHLAHYTHCAIYTIYCQKKKPIKVTHNINCLLIILTYTVRGGWGSVEHFKEIRTIYFLQLWRARDFMYIFHVHFSKDKIKSIKIKTCPIRHPNMSQSVPMNENIYFNKKNCFSLIFFCFF